MEEPKIIPDKNISIDFVKNLGDAEHHMLTRTAIQSLMRGELNFYLSLPKKIKTTLGFPLGRKVEKHKDYNTYEIRAKKMLDWLKKNCYNDFSWVEVIKLKQKFDLKLERFDNRVSIENIERDNNSRSELKNKDLNPELRKLLNKGETNGV